MARPAIPNKKTFAVIVSGQMAADVVALAAAKHMTVSELTRDLYRKVTEAADKH